MRVVRFGSAELIVGHIASGAGSVGQVLHLPAPASVAHVDVELAVRAETEHAAIVIATERLTGVLLKCPESDEIVSKVSAVPFQMKRSTRLPRRNLGERRLSPHRSYFRSNKGKRPGLPENPGAARCRADRVRKRS